MYFASKNYSLLFLQQSIDEGIPVKKLVNDQGIYWVRTVFSAASYVGLNAVNYDKRLRTYCKTKDLCFTQSKQSKKLLSNLIVFLFTFFLIFYLFAASKREMSGLKECIMALYFGALRDKIKIENHVRVHVHVFQ